MTWAGAGAIGGAVVGGLISAHGAQSAASEQAAAAENAQQISLDEFNLIRQQEAPFMQAGYGSMNELNYLLGVGQPSDYATHTGRYGQFTTPYSTSAGTFGSLLKPFTMQDWQQLSPMYNFERQQGMQGVLNSASGSQGALSGAAQKDLIGFNQNLANTSFNNAYQLYQNQLQNTYQRLAGMTQLGQAAAANVGQQGTALAGQQAQSAQNIGTALAGGQVGAANAWSSALTSAGYMPYLMQGGSSPGFQSTNVLYNPPDYQTLPSVSTVNTPVSPVSGPGG